MPGRLPLTFGVPIRPCRWFSAEDSEAITRTCFLFFRQTTDCIRKKEVISIPNNEFLEILADGGIVTLLVWLFLVVYALHLSVKVIRSKTASFFNRYLAAALISGIIGILIHSSVSLVLRTTAAQIFFYFLLALSWANFNLVGVPSISKKRSRKSPTAHLSLSHFRSIAISIIALAISCESVGSTRIPHSSSFITCAIGILLATTGLEESI